MPPLFSFSKKCNQYKTIGILGGMGPEATAQTYLEIIKLFQERFGAKYDADFPEIIIVSKAIPDVVESVENEQQTIAMLNKGMQQLATAGADFAIIACNTVQRFLPQLRKAAAIPTAIPLLGIAEEVAKRVQCTAVGLLATEATIAARIFDDVLVPLGVIVIKPDKKEQEEVTRIILNIMNGKKNDADKAMLLMIIDSLKLSGAEAVILGCTDLPLLISQDDVSILLVDTTKVNAEAAVNYCRSAQTI